jgi:hypothetical protein
MADDSQEIVAMGNYGTAVGVTSNLARPRDMLFAAHLDNLHQGTSLAPALQARERHALPRPEGNEYSQQRGCGMLLH